MSAVSWITSTDRSGDSERPTDLAPCVSRRNWHYFYRATHACIARYSIHQADSSAAQQCVGDRHGTAVFCRTGRSDRIRFQAWGASHLGISQHCVGKNSVIAKNRVASMQIFVLLRICRSIFPLLRGGGASIVALSTTPQHRQPAD